jgi:hypothetical protein
MVKTPPISLRIRAAETTARARRLLRSLDEDAQQQRRVRWLAAKGFLAVSKLNSALAQLKPCDRDRWQKDVQRIESTLLKMSKRAW